MDTYPPSDAEAVLASVRRLLVDYRRSLISSLSFADTLMRELPRDPYTWATLVRYWAWQEMKQRQALPDLGWSARRLACNGMEMTCGPYLVRPFKSIDAGPPAPGTSQVKDRYWRQADRHDFEQGRLFGDASAPQGANLLLDWAVDDERDPVIALSKPVGTWRYRGKPQLEWRHTIRFGGGDDDSGLRWTPSEDDGSGWDFGGQIDRTEIASDDA